MKTKAIIVDAFGEFIRHTGPINHVNFFQQGYTKLLSELQTAIQLLGREEFQHLYFTRLLKTYINETNGADVAVSYFHHYDSSGDLQASGILTSFSGLSAIFGQVREDHLESLGSYDIGVIHGTEEERTELTLPEILEYSVRYPIVIVNTMSKALTSSSNFVEVCVFEKVQG